MEHPIALNSRKANKLAVLVQMLVESCAELVRLAALLNRAVEQCWLACDLFSLPPMSNVEAERRACEPKWLREGAESSAMLLLGERLQDVNNRLSPHLDDLLSQVQPAIRPCLYRY